MKTLESLISLGLVLLCAGFMPAYSKQYAIVVGIDQYQPSATGLKRLKGAVNDAKLIAETLRGIGVELPASRVLLNEQATLGHFQAAWQDVLAQAKPGERIIVTFAGHGSHEKDSAPLDEQDGKDETLLFYDYDRDTPKAGRLSDDALYAMFQAASRFSILFVSDSCHAGGMMRDAASSSPLPSRDGPEDKYYQVNLSMPAAAAESGDDNQLLEHVTWLLAMADEAKKINEVLPPGQDQVHGALSFAFAEAIRGLADSDGDHLVSRKELASYISNRVVVLSEHKQIPNLLPRSGDETALDLLLKPAKTGESASTALDKIALPIQVEGGSPPAGVASIRLNAEAYRLRFVIGPASAKIYNVGGDFVGEIPAHDAGAWNNVIDKYRFLTALDGNPQGAGNAGLIALDKGGKAHPLGEIVTFSFGAESPNRYFLLFDLPGNGKLQFLYPLPKSPDPLALPRVPYALPIKIDEPLGEDDVVAVLCERQNDAAVALLSQYNGKNPPPAAAFFKATQGCQVGKYAFFTTAAKAVSGTQP
ncbi:MAG: caspase family protein [Candidatus Methylumidiphilus sp.]